VKRGKKTSKKAGGKKRQGSKDSNKDRKDEKRAPKTVANPSAEVFAALNECQHSFTNHRKAASLLLSTFKRMDADTRVERFLGEILIPSVDRVLVVASRTPAVERMVGFFADFCCTAVSVVLKSKGKDDQESSLHGLATDLNRVRDGLLLDLVDKSRVAEKTVRFRACQLIAHVLAKLGTHQDEDLNTEREQNDEWFELSDDVWDTLSLAIAKRATDKVAIVRVQAFECLRWLQSPDVDENGVVQNVDPVTTLLINAITSDTCKDVRKVAVEGIAVMEATLLPLLSRAQDIDVATRCTTLDILSRKVCVANLTIDQVGFAINFSKQLSCHPLSHKVDFSFVPHKISTSSISFTCGILLPRRWPSNHISPFMMIITVGFFLLLLSAFPIPQRLSLLRSSLMDREPEVRKFGTLLVGISQLSLTRSPLR
jgi:hypothetical protein